MGGQNAHAAASFEHRLSPQLRRAKQHLTAIDKIGPCMCGMCAWLACRVPAGRLQTWPQAQVVKPSFSSGRAADEFSGKATCVQDWLAKEQIASARLRQLQWQKSR